MFKKTLRIFQSIILKFYNPTQKAEYLKKRRGMRIGENCQIFNNVSFGSEPYLIEMGNYVKITGGTQFITHDGGVEVLRNLELLKNADLFGEIIIGNNVFIGNNCIILPGVTIGDNVVIGAGSTVTKDIPSNSVWAGAPAKHIRTINEYYERHKDNADFTKHLSRIDKKEYLINKYNIK